MTEMGEKSCEDKIVMYHRAQCTEPCDHQMDWTCCHEGSIVIENRKCISFKPRPEVEKP